MLTSIVDEIMSVKRDQMEARREVQEDVKNFGEEFNDDKIKKSKREVF